MLLAQLLAAIAAVPVAVSLVGLDGADLATKLVHTAPPKDAPNPTLWILSEPVRQTPGNPGGAQTAPTSMLSSLEKSRNTPPAVMLVEMSAALRGEAWGAFGESNETPGAAELLAAALMACSTVVQAVSSRVLIDCVHSLLRLCCSFFLQCSDISTPL